MNTKELKAARKRKNMTQRELATYLGVSYSALTKYETAQNPIPKWIEDKLAERPQGLVIGDLSADELADLEKKAASRGVSSDKLGAEMIRAFIKLSLLVLAIGHAVMWSDNNVLRGLRGGRRAEAVAEVLDIGDADRWV